MAETVYGALADLLADVPDSVDVWMQSDEIELLIRLLLVRLDRGRHRRHANQWWQVYHRVVRAYGRSGAWVGRHNGLAQYHGGTLYKLVRAME